MPQSMLKVCGWVSAGSGRPAENAVIVFEGLENLCPDFKATGRDLPGGYAQYVIVDQDFAFPIPSVYSDLQAAPLCAGAIGWRSLRLAGLRDGESRGLTGFGASAHLVLTLARHLYPRSEIFVFCAFRTESENLLWSWVHPGPAIQPTKVAQMLAAVIDTTPAWKPVMEALEKPCARGKARHQRHSQGRKRTGIRCSEWTIRCISGRKKR